MKRARSWGQPKVLKNLAEASIPLVVVILVWEAFSRGRLVNPTFFPPPTAVFDALVGLSQNGELFVHTLASLNRVMYGFIIGVVPGIIIGLAMGWWSPFNRAIDPLLSITYPLPKVAVLPLFLLIFGLGDESKIALIATSCFYPLAINVAYGVRTIDPVLIKMAVNLGANTRQIFTKLVLPHTFPMIFAGIRLALGVALIIVVTAEFVAANEGLGYLTWISWQTLFVDKMYVGIVTVGILGAIFTYALLLLQKKMMPWSREIRA